MDSESRPAESPIALLLVAGLFMLWGVLAIAKNLIALADGRLFLNLGIVQLPIGIGLLAHSAF